MSDEGAAQIRELLAELLAAYNSGDVDAIARIALLDWIVFGTRRTVSSGGDRERLEEAFAAGLRTDLHWQHLYVRVYGDVAIASGYIVGSVRLPHAAPFEGPWKFYKVWTRREGEWRMAEEGELPEGAVGLLSMAGSGEG